jgi:hypothetical protein
MLPAGARKRAKRYRFGNVHGHRGADALGMLVAITTRWPYPDARPVKKLSPDLMTPFRQQSNSRQVSRFKKVAPAGSAGQGASPRNSK